MTHLTDEQKFSEVLRIMQEVHFFGDKIFSSKLDKEEAWLIITYELNLYFLVDLLFCSNNLNQDDDCFMLYVINKPLNDIDESTGYFNVFDWSNYKGYKLERDLFDLNTYQGTYLEKLKATIRCINEVLTMPALLEIFEKKEWEKIPFDWTRGH